MLPGSREVPQVRYAVPGGGGGYAIAHDLNRGLVRNGTVFNLATLAVEGHVDAHGDGIRYEPVTRRAFTWEGRTRGSWTCERASS